MLKRMMSSTKLPFDQPVHAAGSPSTFLLATGAWPRLRHVAVQSGRHKPTGEKGEADGLEWNPSQTSSEVQQISCQ